MRKDINHHTQLLNYLIERYGLKSYLEIGLQNPANNFDKINANVKVGVDPNLDRFENIRGQYFIWAESSDDFFDKKFIELSSKCGPVEYLPHTPFFDLIFIDGDHAKEQVKRDFDNSLRCLNDNGFIVIHDTLPLNEQGTRVPRETKQWWGDVYKFAFELNLYPGIDFCTYDFDNGCTVVWKTDKDLSIMQLPEVDYEFYLNNKHLLRIRDCVD